MEKIKETVKRRGFTLMELLLVIALVAIVAAVGGPTAYHNFIRESDSNMLNSLIVEIEYCRTMGLMDMPDYATFETFGGTPDFKCATQTKSLDGSVTFKSSRFFAFDRLGKLIDNTGAAIPDQTITLTSGGVDKGTVLITSAGVIKRQ